MMVVVPRPRCWPRQAPQLPPARPPLWRDTGSRSRPEAARPNGATCSPAKGSAPRRPTRRYRSARLSPRSRLVCSSPRRRP